MGRIFCPRGLIQRGQKILPTLPDSKVAYREASHGGGIREVKTAQRTWAGLSHQPEFEASWREQIAHATFPSGLVSDTQRNDVEVLLIAKLAGAILVTTDGASKTQPRGILGSKRELESLGIMVVTPAEAVAIVKANWTRQ